MDNLSLPAGLPGSLRLVPSFPFVGRPRELAALRSLMPTAAGEGRRIALVSGEPGSGKSRLVREFAHQAAAEGALVLHGGCDAVVRIAYQPVVEALEHLVRSSDPRELRGQLGLDGSRVAARAMACRDGAFILVNMDASARCARATR